MDAVLTDVLSVFCAKEHFRYAIGHAWPQPDGFTYATDGKWIIRRKTREGDVTPDGRPPDGAAVMAMCDKIASDWAPLNIVIPPSTCDDCKGDKLQREWFECESCKGEGEIVEECPECHNETREDCDKCDGEGGKLSTKTTGEPCENCHGTGLNPETQMPVGHLSFDPTRISVIQAHIPNAEYRLTKTMDGGFMHFRNDEYEGLLMCLDTRNT